MKPTVYSGDMVMINTGRRHIYEGSLYAIRLDNTAMIKRLSLRPKDKILVISNNKEEYESYETAREDIHVLV